LAKSLIAGACKSAIFKAGVKACILLAACQPDPAFKTLDTIKSTSVQPSFARTKGQQFQQSIINNDSTISGHHLLDTRVGGLQSQTHLSGVVLECAYGGSCDL
jgi:hypothetical protein